MRAKMDSEIVEKARELEDNGDLKGCIAYIDENIGKLESQASRSDLLRIRAECFLYQESPDQENARKSAEEALKIATENGDQKRIADSSLLLSQIVSIEDAKKAEELGRKALSIYQSLNDKEEELYSIISIATILDDFKEASSLFEKAIRESEASGNVDMLAQATVNYAYLLLENGKGEDALRIIDSAIKRILENASKLKRKDERIRFVADYSEIFDAASDIAMEMDMYDVATKYASYINRDPIESLKGS
jgi:tetratricopeptide (TPR) repeat protein